MIPALVPPLRLKPILSHRYIELWSQASEWVKQAEHVIVVGYPVIGHLPIGAVQTEAVVRILTPIWTSKTETATRLRGRIEAILDWAAVHGLRQGDNPARLKGHLEHMLPKLRDARHVHHPALPYEHLPAFVAELQHQDGIAH